MIAHGSVEKKQENKKSKDWTMCYSQKSIYTDTYTILHI